MIVFVSILMMMSLLEVVKRVVLVVVSVTHVDFALKGSIVFRVKRRVVLGRDSSDKGGNGEG